MLKHVSYRSTASLSRDGSNFSCRGSVVRSDSSFKKLPRTPDLSAKNSIRRLSVKEDSVDSEDSLKNISYRDDLEDVSLNNFQPDTVSLASAYSFMSLASCSGRFSASRCSSTLSLSDPSAIPVRIHLRRLRPDMEYKTLPLSSLTTCRELIHSLLTKFRLRHRDPNLFYVLMEVTVRSPTDSTPVRRVLVLDDNARPAELQQCRPKGEEARFSVGVKRGGLVRVHDSILMQGSQYKSLILSYDTNADDLVRLLLNCYNSPENHHHYSVHEVCSNPYKDRPLKGGEFPLRVQAEWPKTNRNNWSFVLRRNINYTLSLKSKLFWRRSLDQSSTDTESEIEEHNTTRASIMSTASSVSNSSTSSGVSTDSCGSSSSGVSSGDSCLSSPSTTPQKPMTVLPRSPMIPAKTSTPISKANPPVQLVQEVKPAPLPNGSSSPVPPLPSRPSKPDVVPARPPKPVPRTLFPSLSSLSIMKESSVDTDTEDSAISSPSTSICERLSSPEPPRDKSHSISFGSYSHSSPKQANVRSLSKSFVNLSLLSPIYSKPHLSSSPPPKSANSPLIKVRSLTLSQKNLSLLNSGLPKCSKSRSEFNLTDSSCLRNCENCFYI